LRLLSQDAMGREIRCTQNDAREIVYADPSNVTLSNAKSLGQLLRIEDLNGDNTR
jgi:hypothetical protein